MTAPLRTLLVLSAVVCAPLGLAACGGGRDESVDGGAPPGARPATTAAAAAPTVDPARIAPRVARGEVLLVDVRRDDEWDAGHAADAIHVPLAELEARLGEVRRRARGRPVAFICRSGTRSAQAARIAAAAGLPDVLDAGGMAGWVDAGLPIVPSDGRIL